MVTTLTSKGQMTLPKEIRDRFHLKAGDRLDIQVNDEGTIVLRPITKPIDALFGRLARKDQTPRTIEELDRGVEEAFRRGEL